MADGAVVVLVDGNEVELTEAGVVEVESGAVGLGDSPVQPQTTAARTTSHPVCRM